MNVGDVRFSINQYIEARAAELGYSDVKILAAMSGLKETRPIWVNENVAGGGNNSRTRAYVDTNTRFQVAFCTKDYLEAERWVGHFGSVLMNLNWRMPGIMVDFMYPQPKCISRVAQGGSIAAGVVYVAVAGYGYVDESQESLASIAVPVTVAHANSVIDVLIPGYPGYSRWFSKYDVYAGASPTTLKKTADSPLEYDDFVMNTLLYTMTSMPNGIAPPVGPPDNHIEIKYRPISILRNTYSETVIREPNTEAEQYIGMNTFTAQAPLTATPSPDYPLASVTTKDTFG